MEELLDELLASCGDLEPDAFAARHPYPFLIREVHQKEGTRKLTKEEQETQAARFERTLGRRGGYVLSQYGVMSIQSLLREVVVGAEARVDTTVVRLRSRAGTWPVTCGAGPDADVVLPGGPPVAFSVERDAAGDCVLAGRGAGVWFNGEPLVKDARAPLEEGAVLEAGPSLAYQAFTPSGFALFLSFRKTLVAARAQP